LTIQGRKTDGLVPLADLLNHRRPRETKWAFEDAVNGFVITSLRALEGGQQVHDSYGRKCNSRFFVNYGFALDDNPDNEVSFTFSVPASDPFYAFRMRLLGGQASREFSLNALFSHKDVQTREAFSFLRFLVARGSEVSVLATSKTFTVSDIAPISTQNELRVLEYLRAFAQHALSEFDASLEQDTFILQNESLSEKQRNCIRMRRGEKLVYSKFIKLAEVSTRLLQVNWKELKKIVMSEFASGSGDYDDYIATVIVPLVKAESRQIAQ
jgi:histone-lysine N-methyltransferase SETD3